jgi:hypothetical protein
MGTDSADVNGDGRMDLFVTALDYQTNELYLNNGDLTFTDVTFRAGLAEPSFLKVGFGMKFLDYDNDGDKDLLVVNGHIIDNIHLYRDQVTYEQSPTLLANDGAARLKDVSRDLGERFARPMVGRGLAVADYDDDGDLDFFVVNNNRPGELFRNDGANDPARGGGHWLTIKLRGVQSNRNGIGARVRVLRRDAAGAERWQTDEVRTGSSYCSQSDSRLHFGLGPSTTAAVVEIHWPGGGVQTLKDVKADQILAVTEAATGDK